MKLMVNPENPGSERPERLRLRLRKKSKFLTGRTRQCGTILFMERSELKGHWIMWSFVQNEIVHLTGFPFSTRW